jgi:MFS family permease
MSLNALLIAFAEMLVIRAVERFDPLKTVGIGALLVGLGLALLPLGPPLAVAVVCMVVLTFGEMMALPITNATVADRAGRAQVGRYMGSYTLAFSAAFVLGPISGTAVYQHLGPEVLWYGLGVVGIILGVGFSMLSSPMRSVKRRNNRGSAREDFAGS